MRKISPSMVKIIDPPILENLIRWGFKGQIFGVNPTAQEDHVHGIRLFKEMVETPDVASLLKGLKSYKILQGLRGEVLSDLRQ